ncbi:sugar-transfer associated ATP-grasp domain-containing protein [Croceivirga thetidis]|uniref:Alpha-L-glutamate ligase-like protein n=1 Tax=Croceivirga thetidis TaxID=2721623 RepID=A0ABX1GS97_9FLAO|nr:sugar-transfer associated ATP-grasp domain-containing protein [Croceivirga thetidis]NKI31800.1 alpha-L-glutamate ligase-like protein [Croceivirga thetidis]
MIQKIFKVKNPKGVIGLNRRNIQFIYPHNQRKDYILADDKVKAKMILHQNDIACAKTYAVVERISDIKSSWKGLQEHRALVIKPAKGCGGGGIKILKKNSLGKWQSSGKTISDEQIFHHITRIISGLFSMASNDVCLIEECIMPHPFFAEIYDEGVPDFRIITLKGKPLMAMLRMPTSRSDGKANLHQKGVGIGVDMLNGTLTQVYDGKQYSDHHPDNENSVNGKKIPYWFTMMQLARKTAQAFPLDYLGIDLVIDKVKGPQIMEVNVRPGLGIQLVNKQGLQSTL